MAKKSVGSIIRELINEKNFSVEQVAKLIGKSRQQVYNDCNRVKMKDDEIELYAKALDVKKDLFYSMQDNEESVESGSYLLEHLNKLEGQFKALAEQSKAMADHLQTQLAVKDRQIERLLDLLGKLDLSENTPCGEERQMYLQPAA